jgi:hypothetical protein
MAQHHVRRTPTTGSDIRFSAARTVNALVLLLRRGAQHVEHMEFALHASLGKLERVSLFVSIRPLDTTSQY